MQDRVYGTQQRIWRFAVPQRKTLLDYITQWTEKQADLELNYILQNSE